ncbi:Zinc finger protein 333 [Portunus trituberculatus]|uniref:Zinc finger protein 333 n=1 Tax=Portunus trituberculatus TaxID=210409 RepID=A0A5B7D988_PORTR|nr:Zinc finger protein 333 [Portunus trituberculatus]
MSDLPTTPFEVTVRVVYTCGECGIKIQGTVSIVRHLLAHDTDQQKPAMALLNGTGDGGGQALLNGEGRCDSDSGGGKEGNTFSEHVLAGENGIVNGYEERKPVENGLSLKEESVDVHFMRSLQGMDGGLGIGHYYHSEGEMGDGEAMDIASDPQPYLHSPLESMQVEINPLDILTTVMEEDQKSTNPVFPPEHFLLTLPAPAHFLEGSGEVVGQEEVAEGTPEAQEQDEDAGSTEGYSDVPSDILLDHPGLYNCDRCEETFRYQHQLVTHKHQVHQALEAQFECQVCGLDFTMVQELKRHMMTHSGGSVFSCSVCGQTFPDRPTLKAHTVTHGFIHNMKTHRLTHNEGRNEVCPYCDKAYKSKISLYYHMKKGNCKGLSTKEVPEGYHRCTECLQMFASEDRYKSHKEKGHCQVSHRCQHCGLRCSTEARLQNHLQKGLCLKKESSGGGSDPPPKRRRAHNKEREKPQEEIVCDRCNYTKDCCCTFSCKHCGKRVFSIMAYTMHQDKTCSILKQRRERIRMAIMEKRRRREDPSLPPLPDLPPLPETPVHNSGRYTSHRKLLMLDHRRPIKTEKTTPVKEKKVVVKEEPKEVKEEVVTPPVTTTPITTPITAPITTPITTQGDGEGDDSSSGSLTDLSTFTSPNILQPVTNASE